MLSIDQGNDAENNYVVISGGGITKNPSPTVHITPKPITNLLTSSTINHLQTKRPPNDFVSTTARPPFFSAVSTTPGAFISSSIYYPPGGNNDFHNEGYFAVVTHRPGVSSTAIYAVSPGLINHGEQLPVISNDDINNFPPVRNPNLNMTVSRPIMDESEIATPSFVEDSQLNSKIDLLVNKLIGSMQGNLDNLVDIVYERKNVSSVENLQKKNETIAASKPQKPQKVTTSKPPPRTSTAPPGRPSSQKETTKRPPAKTTTAATKKTTTKKPATRATTTTTRRPPNRVTSTVGTTKKPARRTTTTTTTQAPLEDEEIVEDEQPEGEAEQVEEELEEDNVIDESDTAPVTPTFVENGKIRKTIFN